MSTNKVKRRVGKYELGRTIGEGTFAKVKFARNTETGDSVAIKILDKEKVLKHKMVEQIKREIATMKLIKHPNVVRLHEVMGSKTKIFIVLEFVTGGELFDKIVSHGRMREDEARRYFQQLINVVDYCHSRGVYHRDLKPENLLLDAYGNLKVSDFGLSALSQQAKDDGLLHTTCGTPNYVAPEVLNDRGYDGATADLWSCGVILFVLLAGYLPFEDSNIMTLYKKISDAEFVCPSWISFGAAKLITSILDPNPMRRITIPEILDDEWFKQGYKPPAFEEKYNATLDDVDAVFKDSEEHHVTEKVEEQPESMNAFSLISMSKGLNLGNLFDTEQEFKRETRFTSKCPPNEILSKIEEAAKPLGFDVRKKNYKVSNLFMVSHLNLGGKVVEGNNPVPNRASAEVGIHTNMLGQFMLGGIGDNLESPSTVTVERSRRGNRHTKILQEPAEPDDLPNSRGQCTELSLNTEARNSSLLLGLPNNKGGAKEQTVASDRVTIIRIARPGGI